MWFSSIFAVGIGMAIVIQSGVNRELSGVNGLATTLLANCILTFLFSLIIWSFTLWKPSLFPDFMRVQRGEGFFFWANSKQCLAALSGVAIVFGMPIVISRIGALKALSLIIAVQLASALAWDFFREELSLSPQRVIGAIVTFVGALIALRG